MNKLTPIFGSIRANRDRYITEYQKLYNKSLDDSEIASRLGVSYTTTRAWRIKLQLPKNFKYTRTFDEQQFKSLYNQGLNYSQIAKQLHISDSAAQEYGATHGYRARPKHFADADLSYEEFQILLGTVYGDAYLGIDKRGVSAYCCFNHATKQQNYCLWKYEKLKRFCHSAPKLLNIYDKRTKKTYYQVTIKTHCSPVLGKLYPSFYRDRVKYVCKDLIEQIEPLGLAVWFMDDGSKTVSGYELATNAFTDLDLDTIIGVLDTKFQLRFTKLGSKVLYLPAQYRTRFTELVRPYIHQDCLYKLHSIR